ncbi:MAG TPA: response regulator [Opitutaceae bacterium]|jgi:CheY-like chemotaxis protein|nr:response regulator [Opitutaceae bacterium]
MVQRSILIVDDEPSVREVMEITLRRAGHQVFGVANGEKASRRMREQSYDVVITDLLMPERDGLELIRELRQNYPGTRIIAVSGGGRVAGQQYLQLAKGMGAHGLLAKPFLPGDLCEAVHRICDSASPHETPQP